MIRIQTMVTTSWCSFLVLRTNPHFGELYGYFKWEDEWVHLGPKVRITSWITFISNHENDKILGHEFQHYLRVKFLFLHKHLYVI